MARYNFSIGDSRTNGIGLCFGVHADSEEDAVVQANELVSQPFEPGSWNGGMQDARIYFGPELTITADDIDGGPDDDEETEYLNHYVHHGKVWNDKWTAMSDDECPECGHDIQPFMSEELNENDEVVDSILHVGEDFVPENGWPEGVSDLASLIEMAGEN